MTDDRQMCADAAACVNAVIPGTWRDAIHARTNLHAFGVITDRVFVDENARYVPFSRASGEHLAVALAEQKDVDPDMADRFVAAAWWALHLAGRDTTEHAVLQIAREASAYQAGFLAGMLQHQLALVS